MITELSDGTKMWIRSFYGFDPEENGYIGWSKEVGRDHILKDIRDGDLIMIYGAGTKETEKSQRSYVLGFLQVNAQKIRDVDKSSVEAIRAKAKKGWTDKWTYALPVTRAWRAQEKLLIRQIASQTYRSEAGQPIAVWGAALHADEIRQALKIKVKEVNVYGEHPVATEIVTGLPFGQIFQPSRAFPGNIGARNSVYNDGVTFLYLAKFEGDGHALVGKPKSFVDRHVAFKIGVSSDLTVRISQLNAGIPPAAKGRWRISLQAPFPNRKAAEEAEMAFKIGAPSKLDSLGGEFFWGDSLSAEVLYASLPCVSRF
jgi:hypothetical protein